MKKLEMKPEVILFFKKRLSSQDAHIWVGCSRSKMATPGLSRLVAFSPPSCVNARGMATLKEIRLRLRSVKNIQKITKSMKMVSAAKFARAERELKPARIYGSGADALFEKNEIEGDADQPNKLIIALSSDRGLCGSIHSGVAKAIKAKMTSDAATPNTKFVLCGEKVKAILQRTFGDNILLSLNEMGRKPPIFAEGSFIAEQILNSGYEFGTGDMYYNVFRSVVSFRCSTKDIFSLDSVSKSESLNIYDDVDADILKSYYEFNLASIIYYGLKESACSEQSSRMTAMDNASKNAGEMIDKLTLTFNRTRQAAITKELTEIVSGAAALK